MNSYVDVAKVLLQNGADVNAVECNKQTALHIAAEYGHVDVAKVLLQNGADVNAVNVHTQALHFAAWKGDVDESAASERCDVNAFECGRQQHFTLQLKMDMLTLRKCCFRTVRM